MSYVGIGKIPYKKDAGPDEVLVFTDYNANEVRSHLFLEHILYSDISMLTCCIAVCLILITEHCSIVKSVIGCVQRRLFVC